MTQQPTPIKPGNSTFDTPRIPDDFYRELIAMYRGRAVFWRKVSIALLIATFLFVLAGIVMFYVGDDRAATSEREVEIKTELRFTREQMRKVSQTPDRLQSDAVNRENARLLSDRLATFLSALTDVAKKETDATDEEPIEENLLDELKALKSLASSMAQLLENVETVRGVKEGEPSPDLHSIRVDAVGNRPITADAYRLLIDSAVKVDWGSARSDVGKLVAILDALVVAPTAIAFSDLQSQAKARLDTGSPIPQFGLLHQTMQQAAREASDALTNARANFSAQQAELDELRSREEELTNELEAIVDDRNYLLFMAWIPDLTVRVGAVILLLFITKILLVTYRYTMSLSGYYLGVADAIQLLQPGAPNAGWYQMEHLAQLLSHLVPSNLAIDPVATPADQLSGLAKAWISRKSPG